MLTMTYKDCRGGHPCLGKKDLDNKHEVHSQKVGSYEHRWAHMNLGGLL